MRIRSRLFAAFATLVLFFTVASVRAEVSEVTIAQQYGVSFLPLITLWGKTKGNIGSIKDKPNTWQDMFFPEVHGLPGN